MNPKTRRLLQEIANIMPQGEKEAIIESRATHAINSAINVINLIKENYSVEMAELLEKKLLISIKMQNPRKFSNSLDRIKNENSGN
jgi:hypothetical protein